MPKPYLPYLFMTSLIACCIEVDISVPSFPEMENYFQVSESKVQLTVALNFLGFCLSSFLYGPLSESMGRRRIMIIGNTILLVGAIGCVFFENFYWLLASRFIQGIGASTSAVVVFAMIADTYTGNKALKLISLMNSVLTLLMAIAPVIGGFITQSIGWRGNYLTVAVVCLVSWLLLLFFLPETLKAQSKFEIIKVINDYTKLLFHPQFMYAATIPSLLYAAYLSFIASAPFLYMDVFKLDIFPYSIHQASTVLTYAIVSIYASSIIQRFGKETCLLLGMGLCLFCAFFIFLLSLSSFSSPYLVTLFMSTFCIGSAICYPIVFAFSLEIFPALKGTASSAIMGIRALLIALVVGLTSYFYEGSLWSPALMILISISLSTLLTGRLLRNFR